MATDFRTLPGFNDVAVATPFRTWGQGVHDALIACGLVATSDTGQIDFTTVAQPTTGGQYQGYKMYRFDDTLQATKPIFLKVEFGLGSTTSKFALALTVGTAVNGAGGFPGMTVTSRFVGGGSVVKSAGQTNDQYTSGSMSGASGGRIACITQWDPSNNYSTSIFVERLKNGDGTYHTSGATVVWFLSGQASNQIQCQVLVHGQSPSTVVSALPLVGLAGIHQPSVGTDLGLSPFMVCYGVWLYAWPLSYRQADLTNMVPFTMDHLGAVHTFMPFGSNVSSIAGSSVLGGSTNSSLAFIWE